MRPTGELDRVDRAMTNSDRKLAQAAAVSRARSREHRHTRSGSPTGNSADGSTGAWSTASGSARSARPRAAVGAGGPRRRDARHRRAVLGIRSDCRGAPRLRRFPLGPPVAHHRAARPQHRPTSGAITHTTAELALIDRCHVGEVAATSPARTVIDLARHVDPARLTVAVDCGLRDGGSARTCCTGASWRCGPRAATGSPSCSTSSPGPKSSAAGTAGSSVSICA